MADRSPEDSAVEERRILRLERLEAENARLRAELAEARSSHAGALSELCDALGTKHLTMASAIAYVRCAVQERDEARRDLTEAIIRESEANRELGREQMRSEAARRERDALRAALGTAKHQRDEWMRFCGKAERERDARIPIASIPTEFVCGEWIMSGQAEPDAVVTYASEPSPETGHVGWCWWARGKMGEARDYVAAREAAEKSIRAHAAGVDATARFRLRADRCDPVEVPVLAAGADAPCLDAARGGAK